MDSGMAIYSSHIPLDIHNKFGNNVLFAKSIELTKGIPFLDWQGINTGLRFDVEMNRSNLLKKIEKILEDTLLDDWKRFKLLWPEDTIEKIRSLAVHHEDYILYIEENEKQHSDNSTERWISNLRAQCIAIGVEIESSTIDIIII